MLGIVKNLLRGFVNGLINYLLFKKLSGYLLHELDTEDIMGTNAIYLLKFLNRGFQESPQALEPFMASFAGCLQPLRGVPKVRSNSIIS